MLPSVPAADMTPTPWPNRSLILIVEDDLAVRTSLAFSLDIEGYAVRTFASPAELLESPELPACDCLVIDQRLPGLNGLDLVALLRGRDIRTPAILIASHPSAGVRDGAASARVPLVEKPFLEDALLDHLRRAIDGPSAPAL